MNTKEFNNLVIELENIINNKTKDMNEEQKSMFDISVGIGFLVRKILSLSDTMGETPSTILKNVENLLELACMAAENIKK